MPEGKKAKTTTRTVEEVTIEVQEIIKSDIEGADDEYKRITKHWTEKFNELAETVTMLDFKPIQIEYKKQLKSNSSEPDLVSACWVKYEKTTTRIVTPKEE